MDNIGRTVHSENGVMLVGVKSGRIQGVVKFYPDAGQAGLGHWPPGSAALRILSVHPASRGRGLGRLLIRECLHQARTLKIPAIYLYNSFFMQAARRLYESLGFQRAPEFDKETGPLAYRLNL